MPVACGNSVLTGTSGSVAITPAGTSICLLAADFDGDNDRIVVGNSGFIVGDPVVFTVEGNATLDGGLTAGNTYYIVNVDDADGGIVQVSTTKGGTTVGIDGDGTDGSGHINMKLTEFYTVCNVTAFDLSLDREQIETTSLSCDPCASNELAPFKTYQPGYIDGTGSMTVQFDDSQSSVSSRFLKSSLAKDQTGAQVRLYINTVCTSGEIDNNKSGYIEAPVTILGFSFTVSPEEVTTATVNFALQGQPTKFTI